MGGFGSGNSDYRWGKRDTTDEARGLDVRWLAREGRLTFGFHALSWSRGGKETASIGYVVAELSRTPGELVLVYRALLGGEWRDVRERVALEWPPCTYGGRRPWFRCPGCWRRVAILYAGGGCHRCRHCLGLVYESQRQDAGDRALARAQAIRRRLGGDANLTLPFPPRPKGMHWRTYWRLLLEADAAERTYLAALSAWIDRSNAWLAGRFPDLPGGGELP